MFAAYKRATCHDISIPNGLSSEEWTHFYRDRFFASKGRESAVRSSGLGRWGRQLFILTVEYPISETYLHIRRGYTGSLISTQKMLARSATIISSAAADCDR